MNLHAQAVSATENRQLIRYRQLGHQLMLSAGDSTSRIMPVETNDHTYRISFEKPFAFVPDSLASVAGRLMLPEDYVLTVIKEGTQEVVYGFTSEDVKNNAVPCVGRSMPAARYSIVLQVTPDAGSAHYFTSAISALLILGSVAGGLRLYRRRKRVAVVEDDKDSVPIGQYTWRPEKRVLLYKNENITLTGKEQTLLGIFARQLNQVIDRNLLLKEGWEDEGVITGRSLDMYVSKLRKKLERDASISIKNVHGKGYCLNVEITPAGTCDK